MRIRFTIKKPIPIETIRTATSTKNKRKWCKYSPTCSNYAFGCYKKFNFFKASVLTFWRILRCNPFSKGGYDPVPLTKAEKLSKETSEIIENGSEE